MLEFSEKSVIQAIEQLDLHPELFKGRESKDYDLLLENGKRYPPILVLSEANKILGGDVLVVSSFNNSTRKPLKILRDLGFKIVSKKSVSTEAENFDYYRFLEACDRSGFKLSENLAVRFISSLIAKPFVILTGLSGSGKTKLALAFTKWLTGDQSVKTINLFSKGDEVKSSRVTYIVTESDSVAVTFTQSDTGTKATIPYELINDWINVIQNNKFTLETRTRDIRDAVEKITKFSPQLNSFETHLKAAAFYLLSERQISVLAVPTKSICIVPVGADWTNREPLLGYTNVLLPNMYIIPENGALRLIIEAINNPWRPYFLILDEMNLSHVERYFADFLSGMESGEPIFLHSGSDNFNGIPPSIKLPSNLFIIGTVNIDETTYMFSPKVLDRANVIEFRVEENEMKSFLSFNTNLNLDKLNAKGISMADDFLVKARNKFDPSKLEESLKEDLLNFFIELKKVGSEFGYRTASEILRFINVAKDINSDWSEEEILDIAIMQKLLPKLHGSRRKLEETLKSLAQLCLLDKSLVIDFFNPKKEVDLSDKIKVKYPISLEKIRRMNLNLMNNNYTSYSDN